MRLKTSKGITLIALVITIIVLLILAGVSIAILTGENGILTQANRAKEDTENAAEEENTILDGYNEYIKNKVGDSGSTGESETLGNGETKPYLPEESTIIEDNLSNGVVIKDKNNNEWAWVEVPKSAVFTTATNSTDYGNIENDMISYASEYRGTSSYTDTWSSSVMGITETEYNELKNKMLSSVYTNGGFWISRYEIGTETNRTSSSNTLTMPVSKQDVYVYNYVSAIQAQDLAKQMSPEASQTGSLIFGIQWDLTLRYIESKGAKTQAELRTDSKSWGNYSNATFDITRGAYSNNHGSSYTQVSETYTRPNGANVLLTTGVTERNRALNIYDIVGNVYEWTMERNSSDRAFRGGAYNDGGNRSAVSRGYTTVTFGFSYIGFRTTLM